MFERIFRESKLILTEGALVERLKSEYNFKMDAFINHAGLIYHEPGILELLYRQYIDIGKEHDLPVMIMTPTRKANFESINESGYRDKNVLSDACKYLKRIKNSYAGYSEKIMIGGLLGCKGDAYSGMKILDVTEAYFFHKQQTTQFQKENVDFLFAGIMPEINEAIGMAKAMAETRIPYLISFMIRSNGCLLDGTALSEAIEIIDRQVYPNPVCYMTNCIHPTNLIDALNHFKNKDSYQLHRFSGIQANASILSCDELNNCNVLQQGDFDRIVDEMHYLQSHFGLKIFGGCCGTDNKFMEMLTKRLTSAGQNRAH